MFRVHEIGNLFDDWMIFDFGLDGMCHTCWFLLFLLRLVKIGEVYMEVGLGEKLKEVNGGLDFERS